MRETIALVAIFDVESEAAIPPIVNQPWKPTKGKLVHNKPP